MHAGNIVEIAMMASRKGTSVPDRSTDCSWTVNRRRYYQQQMQQDAGRQTSHNVAPWTALSSAGVRVRRINCEVVMKCDQVQPGARKGEGGGCTCPALPNHSSSPATSHTFQLSLQPRDFLLVRLGLQPPAASAPAFLSSARPCASLFAFPSDTFRILSLNGTFPIAIRLTFSHACHRHPPTDYPTIQQIPQV